MSIVIFLHGRGLGPETTAAVAPAFPDAELLSPTGGVALKHGHTWFENVETGIARPESVDAAERRLLRWLDETVPNGRPFWLAGFSNGGAMAAHMLMRHPARFHGAALFAAPLVLPPWPAHALAGKAVFYAHGDDRDTIVGQSFYRRASAYLTDLSGARCTVRRYDTGHFVAPAMVDDCRLWFDEARANS